MSSFDIIPLAIIVLSLAGIIFLIVRKFPVLASINVETIKSEQEAAKKEKIIALRLERKIIDFGKFLYKILLPIGRGARKLFLKIYEGALALEKKYAKKKEKPAVVFSGFSAEALADRVNDCGAKIQSQQMDPSDEENQSLSKTTQTADYRTCQTLKKLLLSKELAKPFR